MNSTPLKERTVVRERHQKRDRRGALILVFEVEEVVTRERPKRETVGFVGCKDTGIFRGNNLRVQGRVNEKVREVVSTRSTERPALDSKRGTGAERTRWIGEEEEEKKESGRNSVAGVSGTKEKMNATKWSVH